MVQAILRWLQDVGSKSDPNPSDPHSTTEGPAIPFAIPKDLRRDMLVPFRVLQRCRRLEDWDDAVDTFKTEIRDQCDEYSLSDEKVESIIGYFDRNWFVPAWRGMCISTPYLCLLSPAESDYFTDIGLPEGASRDDVWNTNNWIESSFRVFDDNMLASKKTKR